MVHRGPAEWVPCGPAAGERTAKLYTRRGDTGTTALLGRGRVRKDDPRIEALGAIAKLNAALGLALVSQKEGKLREVFMTVQNDLFTVGADLAAPSGTRGVPRVDREVVERLEVAIEGFDVGEIREFVIPRGSEALVRLHWARAIARRAERAAVAVASAEDLNPEVLRYLNRLSSLLYQMAVWVQGRERRKRERPSYRR